jgi:hypothetical protein
MSPVQRSDDPGRNLHSIFLGLTGWVRWPFDATHVEWALGLVLTIILSLLFVFLIPVLFILMGLSVLAARMFSNRLPLKTLKRLTFGTDENARERCYWAFMVMTGAFFGLLIPSPSVWFHPAWPVLAAPAAVVAAFFAVRAARPCIDHNRPVGYWLGTLRKVTRGPRPQRKPLIITLDVKVVDKMTPVFEMLEPAVPSPPVPQKTVVLAPEEAAVPVPDEAMLFDSRKRDPRLCENVVDWLRGRGVDCFVEHVSYIQRNGLEIMSSATISVPSPAGPRLKLRDGFVVYLKDGFVQQMSRKEYGKQVRNG